MRKRKKKRGRKRKRIKEKGENCRRKKKKKERKKTKKKEPVSILPSPSSSIAKSGVKGASSSIFIRFVVGFSNFFSFLRFSIEFVIYNNNNKQQPHTKKISIDNNNNHTHQQQHHTTTPTPKTHKIRNVTKFKSPSPIDIATPKTTPNTQKHYTNERFSSDKIYYKESENFI